MTRKTFMACLALAKEPKFISTSYPVFYWQTTCIIHCHCKEAPRTAPDGTRIGSNYPGRFVVACPRKKNVDREEAKYKKWLEEWKARI